MSAYLRSWISGYTSSASPLTVEPEVSLNVSPPEHDEDDEHDDDDGKSDRSDTPPAFPALNSAQRLAAPSSSNTTSSAAPSPLPNILTDTHRMPPPPSPSNALRVPGVTGSRTLSPPSTFPSSSSLSISNSGQSTLSVPSSGSTLGLPSTANKPPTKKAREKVALAPGYGPLDWAALKAAGGEHLRGEGIDTLLRVTPQMLKEHRMRDDAWSAFGGKVYNITPYLPFHPGGEKELMRVAGRDGTKLFGLTHPWVNVDFMLDACLVGFLVSESYSS